MKGDIPDIRYKKVMDRLVELFDAELIPNAKDVTRCTIENLAESYREDLERIAEHIKAAAKAGIQYANIPGISEAVFPSIQVVLSDKGYNCEYRMGSNGREMLIRW